MGFNAMQPGKVKRGDLLLLIVAVIVILLERSQDAWLARWSGADAWFVKPPDPFEVADRLWELLEHRGMLPQEERV